MYGTMLCVGCSRIISSCIFVFSESLSIHKVDIYTIVILTNSISTDSKFSISSWRWINGCITMFYRISMQERFSLNEGNDVYEKSYVRELTFTPNLLQIVSARRREYAECLSALAGSEPRGKSFCNTISIFNQMNITSHYLQVATLYLILQQWKREYLHLS